MATLRKNIVIDAPADDVWKAIRDVGALHEVLVPGFVVDTVLDGDARVVTFGNGVVAREVIIDIDDDRRRLAYAAVEGVMSHHNASVEVFERGEGCTITWIADLLPNDVAPVIDAMMDEGAAVMQRTLRRQPA